MKKQLIRILSFIIMLTLLLPMIVPCVSAAGGTYYTDINDNTDDGKAVNYLYEHDIMKGPFVTSAPSRAKREVLIQNKFYPRRTVSRMELIMALWNMVGSPDASAYSGLIEVNDSFNVCTAKQKEQYCTAIRWAVWGGILERAPGGIYSPDAELTKEDTLLMIFNFLDLCDYDVTIPRRAMLLETPSSKEHANALQWAAYHKLMNRDADFLHTCCRSEAAVYLYKVYEIYQKKYGLTVVNTENLGSAPRSASGMANMFRAAGAETISRQNIYYTNSTSGMSFVDSMEAAFSKAKALDICYLFCYAHGNTDGLHLFRDSGYSSYMLSPAELRAEIDKYSGMFVVFVNGCNTGTYIKKGIENTDDVFDAGSFAAKIVAPSQSKRSKLNLMDEAGRIKVLCSSSQTEYSWSTSRISYAADAWLVGCGMDANSYQFSGEELAADVNGDNKVSLDELFDYSYERVVVRDFYHDDDDTWHKQHIVCNPENDDTIIFEIRDWEFFD